MYILCSERTSVHKQQTCLWMDHMDISDTALVVLADRPTWCRLPLVPAPSQGYQCTASVFHFSTEKGSSTGEMPRIPCKGGSEFQLISLENRKKVFSDLGSGAAMTPLFSCAVWASLSPHYTHSELRKGGISSCNNECSRKGHHMTIIPYFGRSTFITL